MKNANLAGLMAAVGAVTVGSALAGSLPTASGVTRQAPNAAEQQEIMVGKTPWSGPAELGPQPSTLTNVAVRLPPAAPPLQSEDTKIAAPPPPGQSVAVKRNRPGDTTS